MRIMLDTNILISAVVRIPNAMRIRAEWVVVFFRPIASAANSASLCE